MPEQTNGPIGWLKHMATSVKFWLSFFLVITSTYGGAAAIGLDIPRWAWFSELRAVSDRVDKNRVELLEQSLRNLKAERRAIDREKEDLIQQGKRPGHRLKRDEEEANDAIEELESRLEKIRGY